MAVVRKKRLRSVMVVLPSWRRTSLLFFLAGLLFLLAGASFPVTGSLSRRLDSHTMPPIAPRGGSHHAALDRLAPDRHRRHRHYRLFRQRQSTEGLSRRLHSETGRHPVL